MNSFAHYNSTKDCFIIKRTCFVSISDVRFKPDGMIANKMTDAHSEILRQVYRCSYACENNIYFRIHLDMKV